MNGKLKVGEGRKHEKAKKLHKCEINEHKI